MYDTYLVDYEVSSDWVNWQYFAGVVHQSFKYDQDGCYVRSWVPELNGLQKLENLFQPWTASKELLECLNLHKNPMCVDPLRKISYSVNLKPPSQRALNWREKLSKRGRARPATNSQGHLHPIGRWGRNAKLLSADAIFFQTDQWEAYEVAIGNRQARII
ncbi:hypothetical protein GQ53DRAFT_886177 [Thozetella sp. PMI_491]|nr:hypothetical protein GQ53DRAFT_886177 [Thozetella sp. PMI_491]